MTKILSDIFIYPLLALIILIQEIRWLVAKYKKSQK